MSQRDYHPPGDSSPIDTADLQELVALFYPRIAQLGEFVQIEARELPADAKTLLAHDNHMTVTVENFYGTLVDVEVVQTKIDQQKYAREILLRRQSDHQVVQYGIMRVDFQYLPPAVQQEIESQQTPLGRILIEHDVLREVQLQSLWKIEPTEHLRKLLEFQPPTTHPIYGRSALIYCNAQPAIELLEIVSMPLNQRKSS